MTAHFDLHSTTFAQGVDADSTTAAVKRSMRWLVPAGLLAVGSIAIATTIGNDDGTATVRSLTAAAPSAAPAADVWTGGEMSVRDAAAAVADTNLATNTPNVWTGGEMSVRDAATAAADTNLATNTPNVWTGGEMSVRDAATAAADTNLATNTPNVWTGGEMSVRDAATAAADTNVDLGANSTIRSTSLTPDCDTERFC